MRFILLYGGKNFKEVLENNGRYENNLLNYKDNNYYSRCLYGDCYTKIAKEFKKLGYVEDSYVFAIQYPESHPRYSPIGTFEDGVYVIPNAAAVYDITGGIKKDDILFIRGYFNWGGLIEKAPCFKIFYNGSSTELYKSPYKVDIVYIDKKKIGFFYKEFFKCADETVFYPIENHYKEYDLLFAGNFVRDDKKGQLEFARAISKDFKIAFAGSIMNDEIYNQVREVLPDADYFIDISKDELNILFNKSRICIINSKKTDAVPRITVEALAAGTPILVNKRCISQKYIKSGISGEVFHIDKLNQTIEEMLVKLKLYKYNPYKHFCQFYTPEKVCKKIIDDIESVRKRSNKIFYKLLSVYLNKKYQ